MVPCTDEEGAAEGYLEIIIHWRVLGALTEGSTESADLLKFDRGNTVLVTVRHL